MSEINAGRIYRELTEDESQRMQEAYEIAEAEKPEIMAKAKQYFAACDVARNAIAELKAEREKQGLSLADIMQHSGMSRESISRLENDDQPNPTVRTLIRYASALGVELQLSTQSPATQSPATQSPATQSVVTPTPAVSSPPASTPSSATN